MDTRPPPPNGAPPSYAFVTRVYRRNLRPVVLTVAFLAAIWTLFSGIGFFRNAPIYNGNGASKLGLFAIVIGILYMVVMAIELLGIFAAASQRVPFIRIYAWLSALATLIIAAVGLIRVVIHFTMKNEIINTCTNVSEGDTVIYAGWWGPVRGGTLSRQEAQDWCNRSWDRDSWSEIVAFLIITCLAGFFSIIAFNFYHQMLDPTSVANVSREPNHQLRAGAFPSHYNPPYNPNGPGYYPSYPAPAGPPPRHNTDAFVPPYETKPPGYVRGDDYNGPDGYGDQQKTDGYGWSHGDREAGGPSERDVTSPKTTNPFR